MAKYTMMPPASVKRELSKAVKKIGELAEKYKEDHAEVVALIDHIKSRCPHKWTRYPDPAGDASDYQCEICGKWK